MQSARLSGPWTLVQVADFLEKAIIPVRLAIVGGDGTPRVLSLWFLHESGKLYCASKKTSLTARMISNNEKVGFEIAGDSPPYFGLRGYGTAVVNSDRGEDVLRRLADRYLGKEETKFRAWLMASAKNEVAIEILPRRIVSWDYRKRMSK